jgi:hypothetical protein
LPVIDYSVEAGSELKEAIWLRRKHVKFLNDKNGKLDFSNYYS